MKRRAGTCLLGPVRKRARTSAASGTVRELINHTAFLHVCVMKVASLWLWLSSTALCHQHKHLCDFIPVSDGAQPLDYITSPRKRARNHQRSHSIPSLISIFSLNECYISSPHPPPPLSGQTTTVTSNPPQYLQRSVCSTVCCGAAEEEKKEKSFPVTSADFNLVIVPS